MLLNNSNTFFECQLDKEYFYLLIPPATGRKAMVNFLDNSNIKYTLSPYRNTNNPYIIDNEMLERFKCSKNKFLFIRNPIEKFMVISLKHYHRGYSNIPVNSNSESFWIDHFKSSKKRRQRYHNMTKKYIKQLFKCLGNYDSTFGENCLFDKIRWSKEVRDAEWEVSTCLPNYVTVGEDLSYYKYIVNTRYRDNFLMNHFSSLKSSNVMYDKKSISRVVWGDFSDDFFNMFDGMKDSLYDLHTKDFELFGKYF